MGYSANITDKTTGICRIVRRNEEWDDSTEYNWSEGNFSCDCNRGYFSGIQSPCGQIRFSVKIISEDKIVYSDDD